MAWILEHLAGVSKDSLLEIYLNIIQWGPGIHFGEPSCVWATRRSLREVSGGVHSR